MDLMLFKELKEKFKNAETNDKIDIYVNTEGLTKTQYGELLKLFPLDEIEKLEQALE